MTGKGTHDSGFRGLGRRTVLPALGLMLPLACTSYDTALAEFDAVSAMPPTESEPEQANFFRNPQELPWVVDRTFRLGDSNLFQMDSSSSNDENPSRFARNRSWPARRYRASARRENR